MDDRLIADEFFRGSYTTGVWLKGELATKFKYMAMLANNLSTLGVSAAQIDNTFDTQSYMLQWLPTTGEFGLYGTFGDFDYHEKLATRLARSLHAEHRGQAEPAGHRRHREQPDPPDRRQHHLHAGPVRPGHHRRTGEVPDVEPRRAASSTRGCRSRPSTTGAGCSDYEGSNVGGIADINDHGYQVQASAMVVPKMLQVYFGNSGIYGQFGDPWEVRGGVELVSGEAARLPGQHRVDSRG